MSSIVFQDISRLITSNLDIEDLSYFEAIFFILRNEERTVDVSFLRDEMKSINFHNIDEALLLMQSLSMIKLEWVPFVSSNQSINIDWIKSINDTCYVTLTLK